MVYGGVLLQPRREIFEQALPDISYDAMDAIYYPRVLSRVSGGPIPDDILDSPNYTSMRIFIANALAAGMEVVRSEVGFDWNVIREEVQGLRTAYASVGEYVFGCNSGAKKTLDRNYLADAYATGNVDIHPLHNVKRVRKKPWSTDYEVHCEVLDPHGIVLANHIIDCQYLFMAAGSIHTTRLLLKARALGDIALTDGVGQAWRTNGDELMSRDDIDHRGERRENHGNSRSDADLIRFGVASGHVLVRCVLGTDGSGDRRAGVVRRAACGVPRDVRRVWRAVTARHRDRPAPGVSVGGAGGVRRGPGRRGHAQAKACLGPGRAGHPVRRCRHLPVLGGALPAL